MSKLAGYYKDEEDRVRAKINSHVALLTACVVPLVAELDEARLQYYTFWNDGDASDVGSKTARVEIGAGTGIKITVGVGWYSISCPQDRHAYFYRDLDELLQKLAKMLAVVFSEFPIPHVLTRGKGAYRNDR